MDQDATGGNDPHGDDDAGKAADRVPADDPAKTQKLAQAGDDIDPNEGQD